MTCEITYEGPDGVESVERDVWHGNTDGFVTAYDNPEEPGISNKTTIPTDRVVRIDE